jgi:hypothetical protein
MSDAPTVELPPDWPDQKQQDEFCAALGRAISGWQMVEAGLYTVYAGR